MTAQEQAILELLDEHGEQAGMELVNSSDGRLKRGSIYVWLSRLQDAGHVKSRYMEGPELYAGQLRRKLYSITEAGRRARAPLEADPWGLIPRLVPT